MFDFDSLIRSLTKPAAPTQPAPMPGVDSLMGPPPLDKGKGKDADLIMQLLSMFGG